MKKDKDKKSKEKEESSHLEEFYRLRSPLDIALISLNKQKSHSLFLYGNIRNNIIKKIQMKDFLGDKQKKEKQKQQIDQKIRDKAASKLVPEIINEYHNKTCINKEFCKVLRIKFDINQFYASLNELYRNKMWMIGTDGYYQIRENKHYYQKILKSKDIPNVYEDFIEKDLMRSFASTDLEKDQQIVKETIDKLRNVLTAYSKRNCIVGYCQGMNFIAKFILLLKFTEEEAFWIYKYFLESIIPLDYYTHNMVGLLADQNIFKNLLQSHNPKIFKKFQEIKIDINIFTTSWFICMYTNSLSTPLCTVVFDHCILYGAKTVFAVGLVLLDLLQEDIMKANGAEVLIIIEEKSRKLQDKQQFHSKLLDLYISKRGIELQREIYRDIYNKQVKENQHLISNKSDNRIKCNKYWPICLVNLHTQQKKRFDGVFVFRNNQDIIMKNNHFSLEQAQSNKRFFQTEDFSNVNNFLIVRLNHTCTEEQQISSPKRKSTVFQYSQQQQQQSQLQQQQLKPQPSIDLGKAVNQQANFQNESQDKPPSILQIGQRVVSYFPTEEEALKLMEKGNSKMNSKLMPIQEEEKEMDLHQAQVVEQHHQLYEQQQYEKENFKNTYTYDFQQLQQKGTYTSEEENQEKLSFIIESTANQPNQQEYQVEAANMPKYIFNELNKDKFKEEEGIIDAPHEENKYSTRDILTQSVYYKFYSKFQGDNQVYNGLAKSDISSFQNNYFEQ